MEMHTDEAKVRRKSQAVWEPEENTDTQASKIGREICNKHSEVQILCKFETNPNS